MADSPPRDFTYIKPSKRRLSEYEALSLYVQIDPKNFERNEFMMRDSQGQFAWREDSTKLEHPDWFSFRDPNRMWQRTYVRMQAEQEEAISRLVEDAIAAGSFDAMDRRWLCEVLGPHYRAWSFFEYALFRAFSSSQRQALSDTLGQAFCFQAMDHMRHGQAVVLYLLDLEQNVDEFKDEGGKDLWLNDEAYQPLRRTAEELMSVEDWAELCIVTNKIILPLVAELGVGELLRGNAANHGDISTPFIVLTTERDRRRNVAVADALIAMTLDPDNPSAEANREVMRGWVERWEPQSRQVAEALRSVWEKIPNPARDFDSALKTALERREEHLGELA